jgi:hypothetical protein
MLLHFQEHYQGGYFSPKALQHLAKPTVEAFSALIPGENWRHRPKNGPTFKTPITFINKHLLRFRDNS